MNGQPATTGPMCVQNAGIRLQNLRSDTPPATVATAAKSGPSNGDTANGKNRQRNDTVDPLNSRGFVAPPVVGECRYCGRLLTRKSRNGRLPTFCDVKCRVAHWRQSQKEAGEAGGGRVAVFLALAAAVLIAWWFWPLLADVATMRPRLPENMPQDNGPAVVEMFPPGVEVWPNITPAPTNQAVTNAWATVFAQLTGVPDNQPVPGQVTPYSGMPTITETPTAVTVQAAGSGDTFTLTTGQIVAKSTAEFYADCAYKQAKGQRVRPGCPANAAALLGAGR